MYSLRYFSGKTCVERGYITRIVQGGGLCVMVPRFGLEAAVKLDDAKAFTFVSAEMKLAHKHSKLEYGSQQSTATHSRFHVTHARASCRHTHSSISLASHPHPARQVPHVRRCGGVACSGIGCQPRRSRCSPQGERACSLCAHVVAC
jgi:hypothetical protein